MRLLRGDGSLFWAGGMRLALGEALKGDYDYYVWLNDDTMLDPNAFKTLLGIHRDLSDRGYDEAMLWVRLKTQLQASPLMAGQ